MLLITTILLGVVFFTYAWWAKSKYPKLRSFSESAYRLKEKKHFFTLWGWSLTVILMFMAVAMDLAGEYKTMGLMTGAAIGCAFMAAASEFKRKIQDAVHYIGAIVVYACGIILALIDFAVYPVLLGIAGSLYALIAGYSIRKSQGKSGLPSDIVYDVELYLFIGIWSSILLSQLV